MRCGTTSVSVWDVNSTPSAVSLARSSSAFSMIPLCTTAMRPAVSVCGWAFSAVGSPWVAQRVCPIPGAPLNRAGSPPDRSATRPCDLWIFRPLRPTTATPAES
jgi:hypothetical protein